MSARAAFLAHLDAARTAADVAETSFHAEAAARAEELATERAHAYRRADLMASLAGAVSQAASPEMAAAAGRALLASRLGWDEDSAARTEVLSRFADVAQALYAAGGHEAEAEDTASATASLQAAETADPLVALTGFEAWYLETRETPFWYLFDHYLPETPLVDF